MRPEILSLGQDGQNSIWPQGEAHADEAMQNSLQKAGECLCREYIECDAGASIDMSRPGLPWYIEAKAQRHNCIEDWQIHVTIADGVKVPEEDTQRASLN